MIMTPELSAEGPVPGTGALGAEPANYSVAETSAPICLRATHPSVRSAPLAADIGDVSDRVQLEHL